MTPLPQVEIQAHSHDACIVTLRGEHDPATVNEILSALTLASAYSYVLVDLTECSFLDSTVMNTLLQAAELARQRDGALELVAVDLSTNAVRRTLHITRIDALLSIHPDRAAGTKSLDEQAKPRPLAHIAVAIPEPPQHGTPLGPGAWVANARQAEPPDGAGEH